MTTVGLGEEGDYEDRNPCSKHFEQVAQLSQRDRAAGWVSNG